MALFHQGYEYQVTPDGPMRRKQTERYWDAYTQGWEGRVFPWESVDILPPFMKVPSGAHVQPASGGDVSAKFIRKDGVLLED